MAHVGFPQDVLDLACGNMRFQRFLNDTMPENLPRFYCVDSCSDLVDESFDAQFQELDIVNAVLQNDNLSDLIEAPPCDLAVSFGFLHHVPGIDARKRVIQALVDNVMPGGLIGVSLWQFMTSKRLASKARKTTERALVNLDIELDEGDYLLGWQDQTDTLRYCHSFTSDEAEELAQSVGESCDLVERFEADGTNNALNIYLIMRKRSQHDTEYNQITM